MWLPALNVALLVYLGVEKSGVQVDKVSSIKRNRKRFIGLYIPYFISLFEAT
jgi:hypothetical protein